MNRRKFLTGASSTAVLSGVVVKPLRLAALPQAHPDAADTAPAPGKHPRAITMWEFSWIERRWPGAGYEDWDQALDEERLLGPRRECLPIVVQHLLTLALVVIAWVFFRASSARHAFYMIGAMFGAAGGDAAPAGAL